MTKKMMRKLWTLTLMLLALAIARPLEVEAMPRPCGKYAWTQTDMCLRSNPGLYGNIIAVVPRGAEIVVVSTDDCSQNGFYWARVQYSGVDAYMAYTNEAQNVTFLEFQKWDYVEGTSGWVRLLREVTFSSGPNPELSGTTQIEAGREIYIQAEMKPVRYGNSICRVWVDGVEGYIPANNPMAEIYEYMAVPNDVYSYTPATAPTYSDPVNERGIVTKAMNLRQHATVNSEILRVLNTYEEVWIESLETTVSGDKWYRVNTGTMEGFVASEGITVGQTLDKHSRTTTDVNLRMAPTTNSQRLVTIPNGYKVWAVTRYNGIGYSPNPNWVKVAVRINNVRLEGFVVDWAVK